MVELWRSGVYVGRIARRAGLGHGYIYGMLRAAGENPQSLLGKHVVRRGECRAAVGLNGVHVEHGLAIHEGFTYYAAILAFVMVS